MSGRRLAAVGAASRTFATSSNARALPESITKKSPDDVVITWVKRTALTKAKKGGFKDTPSDTLLMKMFEKAKEQAGFDTNLVEDIAVGTCHPPSPCYESRAAALAAGFAEHTPVQAINRLCGSGLMAIRSISDSVARGDIEIGLAVGVESMTWNARPTPVFRDEKILGNEAATHCAEPMGWTSENVGRDFKISREKMDRYALRSHNLAEQATKSGKFLEEIVPIKTVQINAETGEKKEVTIDKDDGIRSGSTYEAIAKGRSAFPQWGDLSTGANSSQVTDGAAAAFIMTRRKAEELGLKPLARHIATSVVGCTPKYMGIGPAFAIPKVLEKVGLTKEQVDLWEINEAFATMYVYCVEKLGLDPEKVNVNGGAIALGHPLGATGVRQVATGLSELRRRGEQILCTSMCIGSGQAAAGIFVSESSEPSAKL
ncbi:thiolase [Cystobasidium minutum MCA 4210]|uniref:thiolase n=1 Tax=Cystobasidium minutum MCA 4210 TaxID=1397322 RepID=UPI0034CEE059|eukprot:jgi/Rhomi1/171100/fgenesh1_kg.4_\